MNSEVRTAKRLYARALESASIRLPAEKLRAIVSDIAFAQENTTDIEARLHLSEASKQISKTIEKTVLSIESFSHVQSISSDGTLIVHAELDDDFIGLSKSHKAFDLLCSPRNTFDDLRNVSKRQHTVNCNKCLLAFIDIIEDQEMIDRHVALRTA